MPRASRAWLVGWPAANIARGLRKYHAGLAPVGAFQRPEQELLGVDHRVIHELSWIGVRDASEQELLGVRHGVVRVLPCLGRRGAFS